MFAKGELNLAVQNLSQIYSFLIFWFIFSYVLILSYIGLLCHGYDQVKKAL